jgi:hypothetical protein
MSRIKDQTKTTSLQLTDMFPLDRTNPDQTFQIAFGDMKNQIMSIEDNNIGNAGDIGFGVGICPAALLPVYLIGMSDYTNRGSANYGNYVSTIDGSVMVYVPVYVYKEVNNLTYTKSFKDYGYSIDGAAADGYVVERDFINGGVIGSGIFYDKVDWSLTNFVNGSTGIASSIINGNPISSAVDTQRDASNNFAGSFANCKSNGQSPTNIYGDVFKVAKSRGNNFTPVLKFGYTALARLSKAHGQAATSTSFCAWYDSTGVKNFPKGNNNYGADYNDSSVTFSVCTDAYWAGRNEARKTGGANNIAMTTHNGQLCGVADINGNQYKIAPGMVCVATSKTITAITRAAQAVFTITAHGYSTGDVKMIDGSSTTEWNNLLEYYNFTVEVITADTFYLKRRTNDVNNNAYVNTSALTADYTGNGFSAVTGSFGILKESVDIKTITSGNSLNTDHWGAAGFTANFDVIDISDLLINGLYSDRFGNGNNTVMSTTTDRTSAAYKLSSLGLPKDRNAISSSGSNLYGQDMFSKFIRNELCGLVGGTWDKTDTAGAWNVYLYNYRTSSSRSVSARACLRV